MVNTKVIIARVTKNQHERIKINAQAKGFKTISNYIRALALEKDMVFDQKFDELYDKIINNSESDKGNNKNNNKLLMDFIIIEIIFYCNLAFSTIKDLIHLLHKLPA